MEELVIRIVKIKNGFTVYGDVNKGYHHARTEVTFFEDLNGVESEITTILLNAEKMADDIDTTKDPTDF